MRPSQPTLLGRVVALAMAALLFAVSAGAGRTYLWCSAMNRAMSACCAGDALGPEQDRQPGIFHPCCEHHTTGDLTRAQVPPSPLEVPAAIATLAPALPPTALPAAPAPFDGASRPAPRLHRPIRAGPRVALDTCVRLQVFRC